MTLILASRSSARRQMLDAAAVPYLCADSKADEEAAKTASLAAGNPPRQVARQLALVKALGVDAGAGQLILGADQILERADGSILSKPGSRDEAFAQLELLSGETHRLHAAAVVVEDGESVWEYLETAVMVMRRLSRDFICDYLDREYDAVRFSVGCYHIEGRGAQLFDRVEGSLFAVRGLPLLSLLAFLRERGILPR